MVEGSRHRDGMSTLRGARAGRKGQRVPGGVPACAVRELNPCTERRTAVSQESREPVASASPASGPCGPTRFPAGPRAEKYISVQRSFVEASVGDFLYTPDGEPRGPARLNPVLAHPGRRAPVERKDQVASNHAGQRVPDKTDRTSVALPTACSRERPNAARAAVTRAGTAVVAVEPAAHDQLGPAREPLLARRLADELQQDALCAGAC
jgi:hypothetical protein